jgi:predicted component of type VI protein secretion system
LSGRDIFISYSREDRTAARHFAECFEKEGFSVWWDAALHSGETFDEVIETELKAARAVVVLWSPRSVASRWVRAEATMADRRNKLAPAIIEPCDLPIIFELTHTTDLSDWTGDRSDDPWPIFVQDLHRLVERGKRAEAAAPPARDERSASRRGYETPGSPRFAARSAARADNVLSTGKVDDLMMALTSLRDSIGQPGERQAPTLVESDDTQVYTGAGDFDLFGADEFHCLEVTDGDKLEKRFVVSPLGLKIGRTAPADVILPDARVSRTHCLVELADDRLRVSDLNSTNGTYVDGKRISGEAFLAIGSVLKVGNISLTHELRTRADV